MGAVHPCFWLERTSTQRRFLRRYTNRPNIKEWTCAGGWHEAAAVLDKVEDSNDTVSSGDHLPHDHVLWPRTCRCGYVFRDDVWIVDHHRLEDIFQVFHEREYVRKDTGAIYVLRPPTGELPIDADAAPIGALWNASWLADLNDYRGADGMSVMCRTPGGDWAIDGPSTDHEGNRAAARWVRSGTPPRLTVQGSILQTKRKPPYRDYHGHLQNGELREC